MLMAANLFNHQARLNADMPLVLITDDRDADWAAAARRLPHGSLVVVRGRDRNARTAMAGTLVGIAPLLIADDPALAANAGPRQFLPPSPLDHHLLGAFIGRADARTGA
jgi:hypothetical protein